MIPRSAARARVKTPRLTATPLTPTTRNRASRRGSDGVYASAMGARRPPRPAMVGAGAVVVKLNLRGRARGRGRLPPRSADQIVARQQPTTPSGPRLGSTPRAGELGVAL